MNCWKLWRHLFPFLKQEILIIVFGFASMAMGLVIPYLGKLVIDKAYVSRDWNAFVVLCILGGVAFVLSGLFNSLSQYLSRYVRLRLSFNLNRKLFNKLQGFSYGSFQDLSTGKNLYNINFDVERVSNFIASVLPDALVLVPKSIFILGILFYMNATMAVLALALTPFLYVVPYYVNKRLRKVFQKWVEHSQSLLEKLQEVWAHIHLVKALGMEKWEMRDYGKRLIRNVRSNLANVRIEVAGSFLSELTNRCILGLIVFYGGYQVIAGQLTIGSLGAIVLYLSQLSGMQYSLANLFQQITEGQVSYERLEAILNAPVVFVEAKDARDVVLQAGRIEFKNVSFGYGGNLVLNNLSFAIEGGVCVGLVGASGCGKTTISNLILRLYSPQAGEITIDGYGISGIRARALHQQIGVALQDPHLWNDSIKNNIVYSNFGVSFDEMREAARVACIDDFIDGLIDGYNTVIGENACKISEGQKQRIAIARAIIKKPRILILDEALSSVDSWTEMAILQGIRTFLKDSTIIVVSHRMSTIEKMDQIYLLTEPGRMEHIMRENFSTHQGYRQYLNDLSAS